MHLRGFKSKNVQTSKFAFRNGTVVHMDEFINLSTAFWYPYKYYTREVIVRDRI